MQQAAANSPRSSHRLSLEGLLTLGFGSLVLGGICAAALAFWVWHLTATAFAEYERQDAPIALHASEGVDSWMEIERHAELFMLTAETAGGLAEARPYVSTWQADFVNLSTYLARIRATADSSDQLVLDLLPQLENSLQQYNEDFLAIVSQTERLLDTATGINAALEADSQELEKLLEHANVAGLSASMLQLDRIQMGFMLAHDEAYVTAFAEEIAHFRNLAAGTQASGNLLAALTDYQVAFEQYVAAEQELDRWKMALMDSSAAIEAGLERLEERALQNSHFTLEELEEGVVRATLVAALATSVTVVVGAVIAVIVSGRIKVAAQRVIGFAARVAAGRLETRLSQVDSGKFGALELALNTMADRLQESDEFMNNQARRLELSNKRIALLSELTSMVQSAIRSEEAFDIIKHHLMLMHLARGGTLFLFNEERNCLEAIAQWGEDQSGSDIAPLDCWAFRRGQPYGSIEGAAPVECKHVAGREAHPLYLCLPLATQAGILGLVHIQFAKEDAATRDEEARFARRLSEQLGLALANLKLREVLHVQSVTDSLTGLFNRRFLEESLTRELSRAGREHTQLAVLMIDADHFKSYNDTHGHDAGDAVLRQLGQVLKSNCRSSDLACRYGGEEFTAVLPATNAEGAEAWANRLLDMVRQMRISLNGQALPAITVSIGIALYPDQGSTAAEILKQADLALYDAKHAGRNRVLLAA